MGVCTECHALAKQDLKPAVDYFFVQLEIRNSIAEQSANSIVLFEDRYIVPPFVQQVTTGKSCRTRANDSHLSSGADFGWFCIDKSHFETLVGCGGFVFADGNRLALDVQRACSLARSRAYAPGKFRKIVGHMQEVYRLFPVAPEDGLLPFGHIIQYRTSPLTERYAAIH